MPVYEEKLISPLAVRFSQEHVRTTFRNGMKLEEVANLIQGEPGGPNAPYDVVLKPPFPNIEIVRWAPKPQGGRTKLSLGEDMHWYTKDNRRLYVLQKVATKLWPKKVAVEVDVLFTVPSELLKKYDSSTAGLFAALGESVHCQNTSIWHWGHAVTNLSGMMNMKLERAAFNQLKEDDMSCTLGELVSLPPRSSGASGYTKPISGDLSSDSTSTSSEDLPNAVAGPTDLKAEKQSVKHTKPTKQQMQKMQNTEKEEVDKEVDKGKQKKGKTVRKNAQKNENGSEKQSMPQKEKQVNKQRPQQPSMRKDAQKSNGKTAQASESDFEESETSGEDSWSEWWPDFSKYWNGLVTLLDGVWEGPKGETYQMSFEEPGNDAVKGFCKREEKQKVKIFSISYDYNTCLLWWGTQRKFCLDPEELRTNKRYARWYVAGKEEPEFDSLLHFGHCCSLFSHCFDIHSDDSVREATSNEAFGD